MNKENLKKIWGNIKSYVDNGDNKANTNIANLNANTGINEYETFSDGKEYKAGDTVLKDGLLYTFITDHTAGAWDESEVVKGSLKNEIFNNTANIDKIYSDTQTPYEVNGDFRYYKLSRGLSVSIKATNDSRKKSAVFYSKTMPYTTEGIEYIRNGFYDGFNKVISPKEGYPYLGIWVANLSDEDIEVYTKTIIDEIRDDVSQNTSDIDDIKSILGYDLYPSQLKSRMIRQVCNEMAIPIIDQNGMSGINVFNVDLYLQDGIHPNDLGKEKSATLIASVIKAFLETSDIETPKIAALGDSITSNQFSNIANKVREKINAVYLAESISDGSDDAGNVTTEFGNLACGGSTMTDFWVNEENKSPLRLLKSPNVYAENESNAYNVLSNQVLRLAQHTTNLGEQIVITASDGSSFSVPTELGVGKGYTDDTPDIIYIASSTNDSWSRDIIKKNDWNDVKVQKYSELKRDTIPSALRWAIISLQSLYPKSYIFVCTPLQKKENRIL